MMKIVKFLFKTIVGLVLVVVLIMFAIGILVDPNQFKGMIEEQAFSRTGQKLYINGPITWRFFPILSLQIEDLILEGMANFKNKLLTARKIQASLSLQSLILHKALVNLKLNGVNLVIEKKPNGIEIEEMSILADVSHLNQQRLALNGNLIAEKLALGKVTVDKLTASIKTINGILTFQPIEIQCAGGIQHATLEIDYRETIPKYSMSLETKNFEIKPLLVMFDIKDKLEGKINLKVNLTSRGHERFELRNFLKGQADIEMVKGKLHGINLIKFLQSAQSTLYRVAKSVLNKEKSSLNSLLEPVEAAWKKDSTIGDFTPFDSLKGTITLNNGILENSNLVIAHSEYIIHGEGALNLNTEAIQYQTSVLLKNNPYPNKDEIGNYLYKTPFPIKIKGTIKNPEIQPDFKAYSNEIRSYVQKNLIQKTINKTVEKAIEKFVDKKDLNTKINKVLGGILEKINKE
jgi:uncharacterized protein involved in outer membrane biogenesis